MAEPSPEFGVVGRQVVNARAPVSAGGLVPHFASDNREEPL
jgi:hypothetical protein